MRLRYCFPLLLILAMPGAQALEAPQVKGIKFPVRPAVPDVPVPAPVVPGTPDKLNKGELYVIENTEPIFLKAVGDGGINIDSNKGPISIYGCFAYGGGRFEKREFAGPFVCICSGSTTGRIHLMVIPGTVKSEADIVVKVIDVDAGIAPQPPPGPTPTPTPTPVPPVNPYPNDKLRVMMIYESEATLSAKLRGILDSTIVKKAITDAGGEWRCWDKDADYSKEAEFWRKAMDAGKGKALPYVIISSPKGYTEGPLPDNIQTFVATIQKHKS